MKKNNIDVSEVNVFGPETRTTDNTPTGIDLVDCASARIMIGVGVGGITFDSTNKVEFKVTHSDDDSTYTAVATGEVILGTNADASVGSGGIVKSLIAAHAAASLTVVDYIGNKRYVKVLADFSGTHGTGTPLHVTIIKTRLALAGTS